MSLKALLEKKPTQLFHITPDSSLLDAIDAMCNAKVGALLVRDTEGKLRGILTERDVLKFSSKSRGRLDTALVSDAMTEELVIGEPDCSIDEAMSMMTEKRFRHLPVLESGELVGVISIGDLVKAKLEDVTVEVNYLRDYINA